MEGNKMKKVAILFGGKSTEYSVSLESAYSVLSHLDLHKFEVYMIGINQKGEWKHFEGDISLIKDDKWDHEYLNPVTISLNPHQKCLLEIRNQKVEEVKVDAIFPILHGKNGEDGSVQGLIQITGIPLVGCDVLSSALCMDKYRAHELVKAHGIEVPGCVYLQHQQDYPNKKPDIMGLQLPVYVKPVKSGSSLGMCRLESFDHLDQTVFEAFQYDDCVLIEEEVKGFEVGCAVMGCKTLKTGRVDEIELSSGFFNFQEKYTLKTSQIHVPARISSSLEFQIQETAKEIYRILGCQIFARVDMFLTPDHHIVFNEVNTIPGFTAHSRYPMMMEKNGLSFQTLLTQLIEMGIQHANQNTL